MRNFYICTFFLYFLCEAQTNKIAENIFLEKEKCKLNLEAPPAEGDPGKYTVLKISSNITTTYNAKDAWDILPTDFLKHNKNEIISRYIFAHNEKDFSIMLLFGFLYGTGYDEITIISIYDKKTALLYDGPLEAPLKFEDVNEDGHTELICRNEPEMISTNTGAYSPYIVYSYTQSSFSINKALSEAYNKKHYVWAGLKYREDIKVKETTTKGGRFSIVK